MARVNFNNFKGVIDSGNILLKISKVNLFFLIATTFFWELKKRGR